MSEYWASLPTIQDTESGIAAIEREQMTKPRPLDVEGPLLHQPCSHLLTQCVELESQTYIKSYFELHDFFKLDNANPILIIFVKK